MNREAPFDGLHWFFDHCETISDRNIERVKAVLGDAGLWSPGCDCFAF